jgi:hypothetical protein
MTRDSSSHSSPQHARRSIGLGKWVSPEMALVFEGALSGRGLFSRESHGRNLMMPYRSQKPRSGRGNEQPAQSLQRVSWRKISISLKIPAVVLTVVVLRRQLCRTALAEDETSRSQPPRGMVHQGKQHPSLAEDKRREPK